MQPKLTKKQSEILTFVVGFLKDRGYAPSYRELAEHIGVSSPATVHEHVANLEKKGYLRRGTEADRAIEVEPSFMRFSCAIELPLKGLITAGAPIEALETNEMIAVPADLALDGVNSYVLRVKGDSMIEDGILSGDFVVVERNPSPRNGDVVVALLDNAYATLKRFYRERDRIRLQPANRAMQPIYVRDVSIQGVVTGVIRNFRALRPA